MKLKTRSCLKRRIRISASGKIMAKTGYKGHFMTRKSKRMIRNGRKTQEVSVPEAKRIVKIMVR